MHSESKPSRVESIFFAALERSDLDERKAFIDAECREDSDLQARVERLLRAHEGIDQFMDEKAANVVITQDAAIGERPGMMIDRYKLLQQIGEGGFGVVFMAEQQQPVRRKVAIKIIKPGMDTKEVVARFEAERQALALMEHPHIARVLDAGSTESGRPYFAMELVRGIQITDYCDQNTLTLRERLALFSSVCQAVQHAHQKGIIHRDIKPSNVLVTLHDGQPVVKVIDFGVAKAIDRNLTERTLFTRFSEMIGTPLYMSPEQAEMSGLDIDTRSDIYSLGVLFYELLTGATPFDKDRLGEAAYDEIRRIIREEEPLRPSTKVSTQGEKATSISDHRKLDPKKLSAALRGDLDWIVMKALEKNRARRYDTAKDLVEDIQHYLNDQPVEARAPSWTYRAGKLIRRYRAAAGLVALTLLTLVSVTVFSVWAAVRESQWRQEESDLRAAAVAEKQVAEQERKRAEALARAERQSANEARMALQMVTAAFGAGDPLKPGPLLKTMLAATEPPLQWRILKNLGYLYRRRGMFAEALDCFQQARLSARQNNAAKSDWMPDINFDVACQYLDLRDYKAAEKTFRELLSFAESDPVMKGRSPVQQDLHFLALTLLQLGRKEEAEACWRELGQSLRKALDNGRTVSGYKNDKAMLLYTDAISTHDRQVLLENLRIIDDLGLLVEEPGPFSSFCYAIAAETHEKLGDLSEAIRFKRVSVELDDRSSLWLSRLMRSDLAHNLMMAGQVEDMEKVLRDEITRMTNRFDENHLYTHYARVDLSEKLIPHQELAEAKPLLLAAQQAIMSSQFAPVSEKRRVALLSVQLYESSNEPQRAAKWKATLEELGRAP